MNEGVFPVEGAEALHAGAAAGAEGHVLADQGDDVGRLTELGDRLVTDAAGHDVLHLDASRENPTCPRGRTRRVTRAL